jgi:hypothetical protein
MTKWSIWCNGTVGRGDKYKIFRTISRQALNLIKRIEKKFVLIKWLSRVWLPTLIINLFIVEDFGANYNLVPRVCLFAGYVVPLHNPRTGILWERDCANYNLNLESACADTHAKEEFCGVYDINEISISIGFMTFYT